MYLKAGTVGIAAPQQCCDLCQATPGCGVWGYTAATGHCRLFSGSLAAGTCTAPAQAAGEFYGWLLSANPGPPLNGPQPTCSRTQAAFTSSALRVGTATLGPDAEQACCDLCFGDQGGRCAGYAYHTGTGACQLYSGASTAPLAVPSSWNYGAMTASARPLCSVNTGRCDNGGAVRAELQLPFNQPYLCCEECSSRQDCLSWNYEALSGMCYLLASACRASSAREGEESGLAVAT